MKENRLKKLIAVVLLTMSLLCLISCGAGGDTAGESGETEQKTSGQTAADTQPAQVEKETAARLISSLSESAAPGSEWSIIAIARSSIGKSPEAKAVYDIYMENLRVAVKRSEGTLSKDRPTDNAKASVAVALTGGDPTDVEGYDLLKQLEDADSVKAQGINAEVWALIAAGVCGKDIEATDTYIEDIISMQLEDGGITFDGSTADVDITAMAAQALGIFAGDRDDCEEAFAKAMDWLSKKQGQDGDYGNAESTAQVAIAAGYLGRDIMTEELFTKGGKTLYDGIMKYRREDGFSHMDEDTVNDMATEQSLCAVDAILLSGAGETLF